MESQSSIKSPGEYVATCCGDMASVRSPFTLALSSSVSPLIESAESRRESCRRSDFIRR